MGKVVSLERYRGQQIHERKHYREFGVWFSKRKDIQALWDRICLGMTPSTTVVEQFRAFEDGGEITPLMRECYEWMRDLLD